MSCLIADLGGTHARFALLTAEHVSDEQGTGGGGIVEQRELLAADFAGPVEAAEAYLSSLDPGLAELQHGPTRGAFAVASPVSGDQVQMTNCAWAFSIKQTRDRLGLQQLELLNDFQALALSLPGLGLEDAPLVRAGRNESGAPMAVLGPGTGLGMAGLVRCGDRWSALPGEGGHRDLAAVNQREFAVLGVLARRFGHVSAERVVSGPGLLNLYLALCELDGEPAAVSTPAEVSEQIRSDPRALEAIEIFTAQLGALAADLVLTLGARGGVFLGGGIVRHLHQVLPWDLMLRRFDDKGRYRDYLSTVPIRRIAHPWPALLGLAAHLNQA